MTVLLTARLRLEPFSEHHLDGLHAMNARPEVMRYLGGQPETRAQTAAAIQRVRRSWAARGTSWWALIELQSGRVAGAGCVQHLRREADPPADPDILRSNPLEIGWRLHPDFWQQGLAGEAAARMAAFAFEDLEPMCSGTRNGKAINGNKVRPDYLAQADLTSACRFWLECRPTGVEFDGRQAHPAPRPPHQTLGPSTAGTRCHQ
jgi:RimJ/RimL family protein N-acetyltransferase